MAVDNSDICPICKNDSLYVQGMLGDWVVGCSECGIETEECDSYEEAIERWDRMMKERISFITKVD